MEKYDAPILPVAIAIIKDQANRYLLSRRADGKEHAGQWEFPGGKLDLAEAPAVAIDRELKEELGVTVVLRKYKLQYFYLYPSLYVHLFVWDILKYKGSVKSMEGQELGWFSADEIKGIDYLAGDQKILNLID